MAKDLKDYIGFQVGSSGLTVSHLQYVDDHFFIEEAYMDNLCTLKTIMCCFCLTLHLRVYFF